MTAYLKSSVCSARLVFVFSFYFVLNSSLSAHRPIFSEKAASNPQTAVQITEPHVSQVIYRPIKKGTDQVWLSLEAKSGFELYVQIGVPVIDRLKDFRPAFTVIGPGLSKTKLPFDVPNGLGAQVFTTDDIRQPRFFHEPFTNTDSWIFRSETIKLPQSGKYYVVAFVPSKQAGKLWLSVGKEEKFGPMDLLQFGGWKEWIQKFHEVKKDLSAEQKKPDIRFLSDDGTVIPLVLEQYPQGSRQGRIASTDSTITGLPFDLGTVWYGFGTPCVLESPGLKSQIAIIPYSVGGGTGVSLDEWCIVTASGRKVYTRKMGVWHSRSCMNDEYYSDFQLGPAQRCGLTRRNLIFEFKATSCHTGEEIVLNGYLALKTSLTQTGFEAVLTPLREEDALQCVDMLNKVDYALPWLLERLETIIPQQIESLPDFEYEVPEQYINDLRNAVKEYYASQKS